MVVNFSLKKDGDKKLTENFLIREFRCRDGADEIFIDKKLVDVLQKYRSFIGKPVVVTSGYRTESHNKAVGGAKGSYHLLGRAIDFYVKGVNARDIAKWMFSMGVNGIGLYINRDQEFVHIDSRSGKYHWIQDGSNHIKVSHF